VQPLGDRARHALDLLLQPGVDVQRDACGARDELDRLVVVRRAEASGDDDEVRVERLAERLFELALVVADDRDARGFQPEPDELAGEERAVAVLAVAANELAARDDEVTTQTRRCRARSR
jgi:hypothetical protein